MKQPTFNYYLTHMVIPRLIFANKNFFYDRVLPNPENMQIFLEDCIKLANEYFKEDATKQFKEKHAFATSFYRLKNGKGIVFAEMPNATQELDCFCIAISNDKESPRYFTFEKAKESFNAEKVGQENNVVGEWVLENDKFKHINWGFLNNHQIPAFCGCLEKILSDN